MANKFTGITSAGVNVPVYDKEAHQALGNVYTKSEVDTELNTKQDNLSTEQLYNIDHALTTSAGLASEAWVNNQGFAKESDIPTTAGLMEESKLSINSNHITAYNGIPFSAEGSGSSDIVYFDYNSGNPELSWAEIKTYMDNGKELIIYDRTAISDGRTKMGYVSNYDKANNFIQFNNVSNATSAGKAITGINWAYLGNNLGWQRTGAQGGGGGATYEGVAPIVVDNTENKISADTIDVNYQQFTHDDSLVHVANDAQYALGVNTRMFRDETVLWEGANGDPEKNITLPESITNFDNIKILFQTRDCGHGSVEFESSATSVTCSSTKIISKVYTVEGQTLTLNNDKITAIANDQYKLTISGSTVSTTFGGGQFMCHIHKVIGIGRKGGN